MELRKITPKVKKGLSMQEGLSAVLIAGLIILLMGFIAVFNDEFADSNPDVTNSSGAITDDKIGNNVTEEFNAELLDQVPTVGLVLTAIFFGIALTALISVFLRARV